VSQGKWHLSTGRRAIIPNGAASGEPQPAYPRALDLCPPRDALGLQRGLVSAERRGRGRQKEERCGVVGPIPRRPEILVANHGHIGLPEARAHKPPPSSGR
jgi:hypothetical protein